MKIKIFVGLDYKKLEKDVNFWIEENVVEFDVVDIRMSNCSDGTCGNTQYNIMVMYCCHQPVHM